MQIHRSLWTRGFTVLPNTPIQDRRLSYTARGLLADLLSRPDGWSEDGRHMADTSPQGRRVIGKALRELIAFGYYRVDKVRRADGTLFSEAHVYDTAQPTPPDPTRPGPGEPPAAERGANPVKNRGKEPTLPGQRSRPAENLPADGQEGRRRKPPKPQPAHDTTAAPADPAVGEAVATLFRVIRPEPRLRLGTAEAIALAPLVTPWLERGYGQRDLAEALLGGLPATLYSAPAILRDRLTRKLPPAPEPATPATPAGPRWAECGGCARPIPHVGICRGCAGLTERPEGPEYPSGTAARTSVAARGRARVRAALRTGSDRPLPAGA